MADGNPIASLYPQPQVPRPLDFTQVLGAIGQINALKAFQSRQAATSAFQSALQPDGSIDQTKLTHGLKDPNAALAAPEIQGTALEQRQQMIRNQTSQLALEGAGNDLVRNTFASLAAKPGGASKSDVINAIVNLSRQVPSLNGMTVTSALQSIPDDPIARQAFLANYSNVMMGPAAAAARVAGAPTAGGTPQQRPLGSTLYPQGPGAGVPGQFPVQNPPGTEQSSQAMQQDMLRTANFQQDLFPMQQALQKVQELGPGATGPGSRGRQEFESWIRTAAPDLYSKIAQWVPSVPGADKLSLYDQANKYLLQSAQTRSASFGHNTDYQLSTTLSGSPNIKITDLAVDDLLKANIALTRMERSQIMNAAQTGGPVGYSAAKATSAGNLDPRAFMLDMMEPTQIKKLAGTLKKGTSERQNFNDSLASAIRWSGMQAPGAAQPAPTQ